MGRYSFIGFRPRSVLRWSLADGGDPYALAAQHVARFSQAPIDDAPPFTGGAVGFFGYDLVRTVEPLGAPRPDPLGLPDMALMLTDVAGGVRSSQAHRHDPRQRRPGRRSPTSSAPTRRPRARSREVRTVLAGPVPPRRARPVGAREMPEFESNMERAQVRRHGGAHRRVHPRRATPSRWCPPSAGRPRCPIEAFSIYRGLRAVNPSPYMYFLDFGDFQVGGCEPRAAVDRSAGATSAPSRSPARDRGGHARGGRRIAGELLADEKERAEHVMLVDLGRNDLGRVCEYGSVRVDELMEIELYSHVMHIVSSVSGTLRDGDRRDGCAALGASGGHPLGRAEGEGDADHRRAGAGEAGRLRRRRRLSELRRAISTPAIHIRTVVVKDGVRTCRPGRHRGRRQARRTSTRSRRPSRGR